MLSSRWALILCHQTLSKGTLARVKAVLRRMALVPGPEDQQSLSAACSRVSREVRLNDQE